MINTILQSIYKDAIDYDTTQSSMLIKYRGNCIGSVDYKVSVNVLQSGSLGSYDSPPEREESKMILESATVTELYNSNGIELTNVKQKINQQLKEKINITLNY